MAEEFNALLQNKTWIMVPHTPDMNNAVGSNWKYQIKHRADGSIEHYKARLITQGLHQPCGIDYHETFGPVIKPSTVLLVLSLAFSSSWVIRQLDVKNAFLHSTLHEKIYMRPPRGFQHSLFPQNVCQSHEYLYVL